MSNKPGNFGGFHIVNIDDTIEIQSEQLLDDLRHSSIRLVLETDDDMGSVVKVYVIYGMGIYSILFEVLVKFQGREESHLHIPPESLEGFKKLYTDVISKNESL